MLYLDTSALVKLVVAEPESTELAAWLDSRPDLPLCTSAFGKVELLRAARRRGPGTTPAALGLLSELALIPADTDVLELAAALEPVTMRTLDALHIASAASLGDSLDALVAHDGRLLDAAALLGLPTASPGRVAGT